MSQEVLEQLERISASLDLLIRLILEALQEDKSQKDRILYLNSAGVPPGRIAEILGTTPQTVYPTLSRARKHSRKR